MWGKLRQLRHLWPELEHYQRFEKSIGVALSFTVSAIILFSLFHLVVAVVQTLTTSPAIFDYEVFRGLFEKILIVLIALEFNHTLGQVVAGRREIIQVRTVIMIGLLIVVRKIVLIDVRTVDPMLLVGLGFAILALGTAYWLVLDRERRD